MKGDLPMKGFFSLDVGVEKKLNEVFQNDLEGISRFEKGLRKIFRIHPWVSKKYGRKVMLGKALTGVSAVVTIVIMIKVLNII